MKERDSWLKGFQYLLEPIPVKRLWYDDKWVDDNIVALTPSIGLPDHPSIGEGYLLESGFMPSKESHLIRKIKEESKAEHGVIYDRKKKLD